MAAGFCAPCCTTSDKGAEWVIEPEVAVTVKLGIETGDVTCSITGTFVCKPSTETGCGVIMLQVAPGGKAVVSARLTCPAKVPTGLSWSW